MIPISLLVAWSQVWLQPVLENVVERDFDIDQPDQVYAADTTYV